MKQNLLITLYHAAFGLLYVLAFFVSAFRLAAFELLGPLTDASW